MKMRKITKSSVNNKFASVENVNFGLAGLARQVQMHDDDRQQQTKAPAAHHIAALGFPRRRPLLSNGQLITTATFLQPATVISINHSAGFN